jgi:hypothetical protein
MQSARDAIVVSCNLRFFRLNLCCKQSTKKEEQVGEQPMWTQQNIMMSGTAMRSTVFDVAECCTPCFTGDQGLADSGAGIFKIIAAPDLTYQKNLIPGPRMRALEIRQR